VLRKFNDRTITCPSRGLLGVGVFLLALVAFGLPAALAADALRHGTLWRDRSQRLRRLSAGNRRWLHRHRQWRPRLWLGRGMRLQDQVRQEDRQEWLCRGGFLPMPGRSQGNTAPQTEWATRKSPGAEADMPSASPFREDRPMDTVSTSG